MSWGCPYGCKVRGIAPDDYDAQVAHFDKCKRRPGATGGSVDADGLTPRQRRQAEAQDTSPQGPTHVVPRPEDPAPEPRLDPKWGVFSKEDIKAQKWGAGTPPWLERRRSKLTDTTLRVICRLIRMGLGPQSQNARCVWPTQRWLARELDCTERTIQRAFDRLVKADLIFEQTVPRRGRKRHLHRRVIRLNTRHPWLLEWQQEEEQRWRIRVAQGNCDWMAKVKEAE